MNPTAMPTVTYTDPNVIFDVTYITTDVTATVTSTVTAEFYVRLIRSSPWSSPT